jgi:hypothetical protein
MGKKHLKAQFKSDMEYAMENAKQRKKKLIFVTDIFSWGGRTP